MPRPAKNPSAIKELRKIINLTQPEFCVITGINITTYQSIETSRLPLSREVMRRIKFATGCRFIEVNGLWKPTMQDWRGRPYTADSFALWQKIQCGPMQMRVDERIKQAGALAQLIVEAGYREKRGLSVFREVVNALDGIQKDYELEKAMTAILGKDYVDWLSGFFYIPSELEQGAKYEGTDALNAVLFFNDERPPTSHI